MNDAYHYAGLLAEVSPTSLQPGLQTQKYTKLVFPELRVCGQTLVNLKIRVEIPAIGPAETIGRMEPAGLTC